MERHAKRFADFLRYNNSDIWSLERLIYKLASRQRRLLSGAKWERDLDLDGLLAGFHALIKHQWNSAQGARFHEASLDDVEGRSQGFFTFFLNINGTVHKGHEASLDDVEGRSQGFFTFFVDRMWKVEQLTRMEKFRNGNRYLDLHLRSGFSKKYRYFTHPMSGASGALPLSSPRNLKGR
uniref:Helitron_like_N domain-containing protein n=1 Tax=Steinernema glaseri TaxID=37863 RepID=A0A1I7Y149_9BILA